MYRIEVSQLGHVACRGASVLVLQMEQPSELGQCSQAVQIVLLHFPPECSVLVLSGENFCRRFKARRETDQILE